MQSVETGAPSADEQDPGDASGSTAAILVLYRPEVAPEALIRQLRRVVARLVVVDNSVGGVPAIARLAHEPGVSVLYNGNRGGLAGAYNAACAQLLKADGSPKQVVLIDDDSDVSVLERLLADPEIGQLLASDGTAAVAAAYRDRATGMRGRHVQLGRWRFRYLDREFTGIEAVSFVINSMSVWRVAALERIGAFNEGLAIDHVDTEYCIRARRAGLSLYVAGNYEFHHSIGRRRRYRLFGRELQATGHSPARRYLIGRNSAWLARRYLWREPAFAFLCVSRLGYEAVGILVAEPMRWSKLRALVRGALTGGILSRLR
jgi:rhamnosyltransferase